MNKYKKSLVIAYKFNDIFYALSTNEINESDADLLIFEDKIDFSLYPLRERFKTVNHIKYKKGLLFSHTLWEVLNKFSFKKYDYVYFSNPILLINQIIIKLTKTTNIILLEDGLMNYYKFTPYKNSLKKGMQMILNITDECVFKKISLTYLLLPDKSLYSFGNKMKLDLKRNVTKEMIDDLDLEGKKIFVGQNLYNYGFCSVKEYSDTVNMYINKYNIDYYLPHPFSEKETVKCKKLELNNLGLTLELLSIYFTFDLFSFSSSSLYTTKVFNNKIKSYLISSEFSINNNNLKIIRDFCTDEL